jgi:hypothetical protein
LTSARSSTPGSEGAVGPDGWVAPTGAAAPLDLTIQPLSETDDDVHALDWWPKVLGAALVLATFALVAMLWRGAAPNQAPTAAVSFGEPIVVDDFVRRDDNEMTTAPTGQPWAAVSGSWAIADNHAVLAQPTTTGDQVSLTVIDLGLTDGVVRATIIGARRTCGIVGRYLDTSNYLALSRVPQFGVWNVERVLNGVATRLAVLEDAGDSPVDVQLEFIGDQIVATAGAATVTVTDPSPIAGSRVGLYAKVPLDADCTWAGFSALQPGTVPTVNVP